MLTFHGTRAGHDRKVAVADGHIANGDQGVIMLKFAADKLVGPSDRYHVFDPRVAQKKRGVDRALVVQNTDGNPLSSGNRAGCIPPGLDRSDDGVDLFGSCFFIHDD